MPDLREQLIAALERAGNAADQTDDFKWNCRRALPGMADECVRQMEWARRKCIPFAYCEMPYPGPEAKMTAAPDDWTPDKEKS